MARCNSRRKTYLAEYIPNKVVHFIIHTEISSDWPSKADFSTLRWFMTVLWSVYDPVMFAHLQCGIDPWTSVRMDCDVIDVNSTPDESAKEYCYFHMHGSHLYLSLAWSFPSPSFGRLCSHVAVALAWLPHLPKHALTLNQKRFRQIDNEQYNSHTDPCAAHVRILYYVT